MSKKKILLVDDEPALTRMLRLNLEQTGRYEVREENRGADALRAAREFRPDLIFLDVMMPDMGGDEIAEQLKQDPELSKIKYAFLTAIVTKRETGAGAAQISGEIFIAKPVKRDELLAAVQELLGE
ncbi:response regulator [Thiohalocapsa sp. ML1]|jgi:CheY-like chemotaxis protein|uniref:response regulator n=1 Tax=Thiohalocapsa sp. ML1 TaxID=1431688 RepID=UPI0007320388|nr:response regulator [Thiohalocapsa sp. ML1]